VGAAAIAAGLDGIRNQIEPPPPTEGLAYGLEDGPTPIPIRLEAALDELEKDTVLRGLMGEELIHLFLAVKRHEIAKATEHARDYPADDWSTGWTTSRSRSSSSSCRAEGAPVGGGFGGSTLPPNLAGIVLAHGLRFALRLGGGWGWGGSFDAELW